MTEKKQQIKNDTLDKKRIENQSEDSGVNPGGLEDGLYSAFFDVSAGPLFNAALAYGSSFTNIEKLNDLLVELNQSANQSTSFCKGKKLNGKSAPDDILNVAFQEPQEETDPFSKEALGETAYGCLLKSPLYAESEEFVKDIAEDGLGFDTITNLLSVLDQLTRPTDPTACVNPYFEQFFNAIPLQFLMSFYIRELLKKIVGALSQEEIEQITREIEPCGAELTTIIRKDLPEFPDVLPLFKLPPVPLIPNVNIHLILRKLLIEALCYATCVALTPLIRKLSKIMLRLTDGLVESFEDESIGSLSEFIDNSLEKLNLNESISDSVLTEGIKEARVHGLLEAQKASIGPPPEGTTKNKLGLWKTPSKEENSMAIASLIVVIRKYFTAIYDFKSEVYKRKQFNVATKKYEMVDATRELGTKELVYLMLGEYNCFTIADMIEIGNRKQFIVLKLDTEKRILKFFKFLRENVNVFQLVEDASPKDCPAEPCQKVDSKMKEDAQAYLAEICQILNINNRVPAIPINNVLNTLGLNNLFNQGVKAQFDQLKNEYQIYLGFPSLQNYPEIQDINPVLPNETGANTDYDVWNKTINGTSSTKFFTDYLMNGGPPLKWVYDNSDISKNLENSTLADICGEAELFETTYSHAVLDIFDINMAKIAAETEKKKGAYEKSFEASIKEIFAARDDQAPAPTDQEFAQQISLYYVVIPPEDSEEFKSGKELTLRDAYLKGYYTKSEVENIIKGAGGSLCKPGKKEKFDVDFYNTIPDKPIRVIFGVYNKENCFVYEPGFVVTLDSKKDEAGEKSLKDLYAKGLVRKAFVKKLLSKK